MRVENSTVLITGANGGIGKAFVTELLHRGAAKIYLGVRDPQTVKSLLALSSRLAPVVLDVTNPAHIEAAAKAAPDVTLLINNAGAASFSGVLSAADAANARQEMEVNYFGIINLAQAFRHTPAFQNGGGVINVLSILAQVTLPVAGTYSASKAASLAITRTLRAEVKPRGVQVLGVLPVQADTTMGAALPEPKLKPAEIAIDTLDALEAGEEEVYPGALSQAAAQAFKADPAGLQAQFSTMVHAIS
ncbi:MAG: SDR family NAD(P)-dependent oxidoreductase [Rhodospirillales bacterium]|nr:SDR family NAD(P)-dependent oxidoreductase [Rhodospirillales bacterium]MDE2319876.1 SDR family NAD(P)-dependent oxidoreductase [Rhodospirillales bacterium]